jgi:hypothetical protein
MENNTKKIVFSGTFLSVNDNAISIDEFKRQIPEDTYTLTENKRVHIYKYTYNENYLKITFGDGSAMPRNPNVFDVETKTTLPNPRQPNQAEPRETFGLIDFTTGFLWLSNSRKRNSLLDFFRTKFDSKSKLVSKDVYDEQKFIETLKKLDDIRLSAVPNLFSQSNVLTEKLAEEINGYEATSAQLHFHYQDKIVGNSLLEKIKSIFQNRNNFNSIVISGRDENNLGMLFNADGFSRKIEFKASIDENEMFLPDEVFNKLTATIKNEYL